MGRLAEIALDVTPSFFPGLVEMIMSWKCGLCCFAALRLILLLTHINSRHSADEDFSAVCGLDGCRRMFQEPTHSFVMFVRSIITFFKVRTRWTRRTKVNIKNSSLKCTCAYILLRNLSLHAQLQLDFCCHFF